MSHLHRHGPNLRDGLFSHAPMVIEALVELGASDRIADWISAQANELTPRPAPRVPIHAKEWITSVGQRDRFADRSTYFEKCFEADGWRSTLNPWMARLAPGFVTAACHAAIRRGHPAPALQRSESSVERRELAEALEATALVQQTLQSSRIPRCMAHQRRTGDSPRTIASMHPL